MSSTIENPEFFDYVDSSLSCPLSKAIQARDINAVKRLLSKRKKEPVPLQVDNRRWTALHVAASQDEYADCLELLLQQGDRVLLDRNAMSFKGETALYVACERGCSKNCSILLKYQCNPKLCKLDHLTPLHAASLRGHSAIVSELITLDLNVNCQDWQGSSPLHLASMNGHLEVVQILMRHRLTSVSLSDSDSNLPLHLACNRGNFEIMKILLDADNSLINWRNYDGFTPLILAVQSHNFQCVKYLLDHGANADICTNDKVIALQYAARGGNKEILESLLQATSFECIQDHCLLKIKNILHTGEGIFHSLMSCVIKSGSVECMSILLKFGLPKSILEAPYVEYSEQVLVIYSPLAYLFSTYGNSNNRTLDQFLRLLLQYNITHMDEFNKVIELKSRVSILRYVNPFSEIFDPKWSRIKRNHYLNLLVENGITSDYCLQCYIERRSIFKTFGIIDLQRFYEPIVKAIHDDNVEIVEFCIVNSVILEPAHLWNFLKFESLFTYGKKRRNVFDYLTKLSVSPIFINLRTYPDVCKIIDYNCNRSPLYSPYDAIRKINLQQLCIQKIRNHLRDETFEDNLKNFRRKIEALPLPNLLKNYLQFKRR